MFIKSFFYSKGKFQPVYFWATVFLMEIFVGIALKFCGNKYISDGLIAILVGLIISLIALYNISNVIKYKNFKDYRDSIGGGSSAQ